MADARSRAETQIHRIQPLNDRLTPRYWYWSQYSHYDPLKPEPLWRMETWYSNDTQLTCSHEKSSYQGIENVWSFEWLELYWRATPYPDTSSNILSVTDVQSTQHMEYCVDGLMYRPLFTCIYQRCRMCHPTGNFILAFRHHSGRDVNIFDDLACTSQN